ncbi:MAG: fibronectin type III domain-containing protein, partial [Bacteroidetes bacterium]|nr:fibronectin type III domain-containing protein [Bacteroidota bacterium]
CVSLQFPELCPPPSISPTSGITDTSAYISWILNDTSVITHQLEWRMAGDSIWNVILSTDSSYWLFGLQPCTEYEYRMSSFCLTDSSTSFSTGSFKTDGCCENPADFQVDSIFELSASANWSSVLAAQSYQVRIRESGGNWSQFSTVDTFFNFLNLQPCTDYEIEISLICANDILDFEYTRSFRTLGCGNCIDLPYCPPLATNANEEWIESVTLNSETNVSGSNSGYGNFTDILWADPLFIGQSNTLSLQPGYASSAYDEYFRVWIDYNQDGDFDDAGELIFNSGAVTSTVTDSFIVPGNVMIGSTRMRVSMYFDHIPAPCDFGIVRFGEIEDYCVTIAPAPAVCDVSVSVDSSSASDTSLMITWNSSGIATEYNIQYRSLNDSVWQSVNTILDSIQVEGLESCTNYELRIQPICDSILSDFVFVDTFQTTCNTNLDRLTSTNLIKVYPNPFSDEFQVELEHHSEMIPIRLEVLDPLGKSILHQSIEGNQNLININLSGFADGVYWLRLWTKSGEIFQVPLLKIE